MSKKIKLTAKQVKMLQENKKLTSNKVLRITESQYHRLFKENNPKENKTTINEGPVTDFLIENMELLADALRALVRNQSQEGLDPIFRKLGVTWGDFYSVMSDFGILTVATVGGRKVYRVSKRLFVRYAKEVINDLCGPTFGEDGRLIDKKQKVEEPVKQEGMMLGDDIEESGGYPAGSEHDPNAPWNQDDSEPRKVESGEFQWVDDVSSGNWTVLFLRDTSNTLYFSLFSTETTGFEEFCPGTNNAACVFDQLNAMAERGELESIKGTEQFDVVDEETIEYLLDSVFSDEETKQKIQSIVGGMTETTTTGSVGGSFDVPFGGESPLKRNFNRELNEDDLDETTMSGDATGSYVQPQIWAKDKKNWRHGKQTMYPNGEIVSEALQLKRTTIPSKEGDIPALAVVSDQEGGKGRNETYKNRQNLAKAGFKFYKPLMVWWIREDQFEEAKKTLSTINKVDYMVDKISDVAELVRDAEEGKGTKKDLLVANIEQYIDDLANATDATAMSKEIQRYLTFFANFHQYSFYNRMLIYLQRPDATKVASYKTWQQRGRQVVKGAKSISILVPIFSKNREKQGEENGEENGDPTNTDSKTLVGFKTGPVFDIKDTQAVTEDGELPETPKWYGDNEPSELADELMVYTKAVAAKLNIKVTKSDARGGERGYSAGGHINLSSDVEGVGELSTMIHEITHELMHWRGKSKFYVGDEMKGDKAMLELQAESVSYVVLQHYGFTAKHHPTYLALWGANKEKIKQNVKLISEVAKYIIEEIEKVAEKQTSSAGVTEQMVSEMLDKI